MSGPFLVRSTETTWTMSILRALALIGMVIGGAVWWNGEHGGLIAFIIAGVIYILIEWWIISARGRRRWVEFDQAGFTYRSPSLETRFRDDQVTAMSLSVKTEYNQGKPIGTHVRCRLTAQGEAEPLLFDY